MYTANIWFIDGLFITIPGTINYRIDNDAGILYLSGEQQEDMVSLKEIRHVSIIRNGE